MNSADRERGPETATLSGDPPLTADEQRFTETLAAGLGRLQTPGPGFQDALEQRLLDRLTEPARPWWRRVLPSGSPARRPRPGVVRMPRRSFVGLAAASALVLAGASISLPLVGTPDVSALEILEKAQANAENPGLAGVKSFHLTAMVWSDPSRLGKEQVHGAGPRELTTEQWFVAPDKMRSESRGQDSTGKTIVSGMMAAGGDFKHYVTNGATDVFMFSLFAAPIGVKPAGVVRIERDVQEVRGAPSPVPHGKHTAGVRVAAPGTAPGDEQPFTIAIATRKSEGPADKEVDDQIYVISETCAAPKRTGEATVAGRPVFVVENDFSTCLPADAPSTMKGRHIRWVDQKTYLPLKMEMYAQDGGLVDRYEVTSIEYDVEIAAKTFTDLPASTSVQEPKILPLPQRREGGGPVVKPITP